MKQIESPLSLVLKAMATVAFTTAICTAANAANITQTTNGNSSTLTWNAPSIWSNNATPSAGNHYFTEGLNIWTTNNANAFTNFSGDSLTVTSGQLGLKTKTVNIKELTLNNSVLRNATDSGGQNPQRSSTVAVSGTLTLTGVNHMNAVNSSSPITLDIANLAGSGSLKVGSKSDNSQTIGTNNKFLFDIASASAFTGSIEVVAGQAILSSDLSLTNGSFIMKDSGTTLDFGSYNLSVSSFTFGTTLLGVGSYSAADLNTRFSTSAFIGDGNLTVIPEASTTAWLALIAVVGGIACLRHTRRS